MRRLLAGLAIGALIFGVAFAGAKVATVTNPMSADLNADHFQVYNAAGYGLNGDETSIGANYVGTHEYLMSVDPGVLGNGPIATLNAGRADPSVTPPAGESPTVLIRWVSATHRELWFNTGAGWVKVAG